MSDSFPITDENVYDFGVDPHLDELTAHAIQTPNKRVAIIRTSDRSNFRRCRRRWNWSSHLRQNLAPTEHASPLWYGSGFHFALEDFHSHHRYPHARDAFRAYVKATHRQARATNRLLPGDWAELTKLGDGMLDYYEEWLVARDPLQTFIFPDATHTDQFQVEVHALIEIPFPTPHYDQVLYAVTLDRVSIDEHGQLWIVEYKTAKRIQTLFFQTDPQVGAYTWIGPQLYGRPIAGVVYQQHRKDVPDDPRIVQGGHPSVAKQQLTTHRKYRRSLINIYGEVLRAPAPCVDMLNELERLETPDADKFIRRDKIERNAYQAQSEGEKLMMELEEMLNPNLPLYPAPTRECGHLCSFKHACVALDDGSDWKLELEAGFTQKEASFDSWRKFLEPTGTGTGTGT